MHFGIWIYKRGFRALITCLSTVSNYTVIWTRWNKWSCIELPTWLRKVKGSDVNKLVSENLLCAICYYVKIWYMWWYDFAITPWIWWIEYWICYELWNVSHMICDFASIWYENGYVYDTCKMWIAILCNYAKYMLLHVRHFVYGNDMYR